MLLWLGSSVTVAQPVEPSTVAYYSEARMNGEADHLMRIGTWGGANLVGGLLAATMADSETLQAFGLQSAAWGAINLGIAGVLLSRGDPRIESTYEAERAAERRNQRFLRLNLVLNSGYLLVGGATTLSAPDGEAGAPQRGHGAAILTQGAVLLLLDGLSYHESRQRSGHLRTVRLQPRPRGAHVVVRL